MKTTFTKYQGAGNDFIILNLTNQPTPNLSDNNIATLCHRRFGIGADGLMTLTNNNKEYDFTMRYWNADGQESTMCGNGGRCIAHFAHTLGLGNNNTLRFIAVDGEHTAQIISTETVRLQMMDANLPQTLENENYLINTGSPHYVTFIENVNNLDIAKVAPPIRQKYNCNVNFVEILPDNTLKIRTWERGVENETLACGTGATAAALIFKTIHNNTLDTCTLQAMGGILTVTSEKTPNGFTNIHLTGPAKKVFDGMAEIL